MQIDSSSVVNEKFNFKASFSIFKEWTSWLILAIEICLGVPLQSVQLFLPQIVSRLGYGSVKTNLYTVAPNIGGAVMLLLLAFASDYTRWRFPFVVSCTFITKHVRVDPGVLRSIIGSGFLVHVPGYDRLCGHRRGKPAARGILCYLYDDLVCLPTSRV